MRPVPGTITVAIRSTRHRRTVPPMRRNTASMPSIRWGWSWLEVTQAPKAPECDNTPASTNTRDPQGASPSSNQYRLALLTRWMINNRGGTTPGTGTTRRSQTPISDLPHQRGIALRIPQPHQFVEQHRPPHMGIIKRALTHISLERIERIQLRRGSLSRDLATPAAWREPYPTTGIRPQKVRNSVIESGEFQ